MSYIPLILRMRFKEQGDKVISMALTDHEVQEEAAEPVFETTEE